MKKITYLCFFMMFLPAYAFGLEINEGYENIDSLVKIEFSDGMEQIDSAPKEFSFDINYDLLNKGSWQVKIEKMVSELMEDGKFRLRDGRRINAYAVHESGVIVGAASPVSDIVINVVSPLNEGKEVKTLFLNGSKTVNPKVSDVAVFDFDLNRKGFDFVAAAKAFQGIPVYLLVDKSGSMGGEVMEHVKTAGKTFLKALPKGARCMQVAFNRSVEVLDQGKEACGDSTKYLDGIKAGGGTNIYAALLHAYQDARMKNLPHNIHPLVIVITDGVNGLDIGGTREKALKAMNEVKPVTFIFWAGKADTKALSGIASYQMQRTADIRGRLDDYFKSILSFIGRQATLYIPNKIKKQIAPPKVARRP